jgi:predicted ArsR family transcriptional regulator
MQSTRKRILEYLITNRKATTVELSQLLNMTQANIRHHLAVLEKEGHVEVVGQNPPSGRGRPTSLYMPAKQAQAHGLDILASAFLDDIQAARSPRHRAERLKRLAERISGDQQPDNNSITIRLGATMQRLNELRYDAHWEAHPQAPRVILKQCPYATIIDRHPELCQLDAYLLEKQLGTQVDQIEKLTRKPKGSFQCVFLVGK